MARLLLVAAALAAALFAGALAAPVALRQADNQLTVIQYLEADERFTVLVELLKNNTDLVPALNETGSKNFTLFAPTNEAFEAIGNLSIAAPNYTVAQVLEYHVLAFIFGSDNLTELCFIGNNTSLNLCELRDAQNISVSLETVLLESELGGLAQRVKVLSNDSETLDMVNNVTIVEPDIKVANGLVHIVDELLIPPPNTSVVVLEAEEAQAVSLPVLSELLELLNSVPPENISTVLDTQASVLFLPSVNATRKNSTANCIMDELRTLNNISLIREVIDFHIGTKAVYISDLLYGNLTNSTGEQQPINGVTDLSNATSSELQRNVTVSTIGQTQLNVTAFLETGQAFVSGDGFNVSVSNNTQWFDIATRNGVIQLIEGLLLPANFTSAHNISC